MALQNLQHRMRGERWVLKNPGHIFHIEELLAVYPDALIVQTHRDPAKVIPSVAALLVAMRRAGSDSPIDGARIAAGNLRAFAGGLRGAIELRKRPEIDRHFFDVHFHELIRNPLEMVRRLYEYFRLPLLPAAVSAMQDWLEGAARHATKTSFTLGQFGLREQDIESGFGSYIEHYGVLRERGE
jgi:hypothetical protein